MNDKKLEILLSLNDRTAKGFTAMNRRIKTLTGSVFSLHGGLVTLAGGYGLAKVSSQFLNAARTSENYQTRLNILLGSVDEGNRLFKEMVDYAGQVPFKYQEIMGAATQLSGIMDGGVDEIKAWMPLIGDLAAASGLGIQKTTEQVIRMYSAGAASADLFRERGILAMMGFKAGVSYSAEETRRIMVENWQKAGSKFRGATDEMADDWDGIISMIGDKWFKLRTKIMDAGVFDAAKEQLSDVNEEFGEWIDKNDALIAQKVPEYIDAITTSGEALLEVLYGIYKFAGLRSIGRTFGEGAKLAKDGLIDFDEFKKADWFTRQEMVDYANEHMYKTKQGGVGYRGKILKPKYGAGRSGETESGAGDSLLSLPTELVSDKIDWVKETENFTQDILAMENEFYKEDIALYEDYQQSKLDALATALDDEDAYIQKGLETLKKTQEEKHKELVASNLELLNDLKDKEKEAYQGIESAMSGWASGWSNNLNEMLWGSQVTFEGIATSFGKMITQMMLQESLAGPLANAGTSFFQSLFGVGVKGDYAMPQAPGFTLGSGKATGGKVWPGTIYPVGENGIEGFAPSVPGTIIPNHRISGGADGGDVKVTVNVINNSSNTEAKVSRTRTANGQEKLDVVIDNIMASKVRSGKTHKALRETFNLNPSLTGR